MTEKNQTSSGVILQYKFEGIDEATIVSLVQSNDLLIEDTNGEVVAYKKNDKDFVVFKWFSEDKEYYSNYSLSTLKNGVLKEQPIQTRFSGDSVNSLEQSLIEAIQKIITL